MTEGGNDRALARRYASTFSGLDALGISLTNRLLVLATCYVAQLLGIPSSRWIVFETEHTTRDGQPFRYASTWQEGLAHGVVNFLLRVITLGLAGPWIFTRNERFRLAHTTTAEGHRLRFTGEGLDIAALRWFRWGILLLTLGLAFPWLVVVERRWLAKNTVIEDPRAPGGSYTLRFDAGGIAYFVEFVVSVVLMILTLGFYAPWARASFQRFVWSSTSDSTIAPIAVPLGPQTGAQWAVAIGAGAMAASMAALVGTAVVLGAISVLFGGDANPASVVAASDCGGPCDIDCDGEVTEAEETECMAVDEESWQQDIIDMGGNPCLGFCDTDCDGAISAAEASAEGCAEEGTASPTVQLSPSSTSTPRFLVEGRTSWIASRAFDGDNSTAWSVRDVVAGEDYLEACFDQSVLLQRIELTTGFERASRAGNDLFVANAHLREARFLVDGVERARFSARHDERAATVTFPAGTRGRCVRLAPLRVWPGTRWQDFTISEVRIYGTR